MPEDTNDDTRQRSEAQDQDGTFDQAQTDQGQGDDEQQSDRQQTWEEVLESLPEAQQNLYNQHIGGLRNTVQATRQERDALRQQLADITKTLGQDPAEAKRMIDDMSASLELANRRATFAEEAVRPEIGCTNPKAAFLVAQADDLFDKRGNPDWEAIKEAAPELFVQKRPSANVNAGAGTQQVTPQGGMNAFIRSAAGRG